MLAHHSQRGSTAALESPVAQHRPCGPVRDRKILKSSAGQPQDIGVSLQDNSNTPCNVDGAFPPSPDERQPFEVRGQNEWKALGYDEA